MQDLIDGTYKVVMGLMNRNGQFAGLRYKYLRPTIVTYTVKRRMAKGEVGAALPETDAAAYELLLPRSASGQPGATAH